MPTSSAPLVSSATLRVLALGASKVLLGLLVALIVVLLPAFSVNLCDEDWRAAPITILVIAGLLVIPAVGFSATRLVLGSCALALGVWAGWVLFFGNALGCE